MSKSSYHRISHRIAVRALAVVFACLTILANGAPGMGDELPHNNVPGTNVDFLGVIESSGTDAVPLFGQPTSTNDVLIFDLQSFRSFTSDGGSDVTSGQLQLTIAAKDGFFIDEITITESGVAIVTGAPNGFGHAEMRAPVDYRVSEIDGSLVARDTDFAPILFGGLEAFVLETNAAVSQPWTGIVPIDAADLAANGGGGNVTAVFLSISDVLATFGTGDAAAEVFMNDFTIEVKTELIPEPATAVLMGIGLAGLLGYSCRRRRSGRG